MKVATSELMPPALDWAVAKACGFRLRHQVRGPHTGAFHAVGDAYGYIWSDTDPGEGRGFYGWSPSRKWEDGGPLVSRYKVNLSFNRDGHCEAFELETLFDDEEGYFQKGPTPLIAAMRHLVAKRLGEFAEVPDELVEASQ